jgi:L-malate glycosyltransferase
VVKRKQMAPSKLSIFVLHPSDLLTDHQPHGDGLAAFSFISRLAERGHTLHVAAPAIDIKGALPERLHLYPIKTFFKHTVLHRLEYMLKSRLLLNRLRRTEHFDVIHQFNPVNKGLSLAVLGAGLPLVLGVIQARWPDDADGGRMNGWLRARAAAKHWLRQLVFSWQQRQATALLVTTPAARASLHHPERVAQKTFNLPIGVDLNCFTPAPAAKDAPPNILFLAGLWQRKGIFTLLEAFAQVVQQIPDCRLILAGDGAERAEVERRIAAAPHRAQITVLGSVTREQAPELLRDCTLSCLPSYGEPYGLSALEAMACGKPVVVTDAGGLADLVSEQSGRKVPPRNATALAQALLEILVSPELQRQMGQYNRRLTEARYSHDGIVERLEKIYCHLLAAEQPSARHELGALVSASTVVDE